MVLADFDNVVEAARCAAALRDAVAQTNQTLPERTAHRDADRDQFRRHHRRGRRHLRRRRQHRGAGRGAGQARQCLRIGDRPPTGRRQGRFRFRGSRPAEPQEHRETHQGLPDGRRDGRAVGRACRRRHARGERAGFRRSACHRRVAVRQFQRRSRAGVFRRRHHRGHHLDARRLARLSGDRPQLDLHLQGQGRRHQEGRRGIGRALCPRRQRAQIGPPGPRHDAVDPGRHEPSHHGREVRSRPHRSVRAAGRDRPHDRRRDRAGNPQIRARAHRRAAAAKRGRLRTLPAWHVAPLPAKQGGQHRGASLFPSCLGDRAAISAGHRSVSRSRYPARR